MINLKSILNIDLNSISLEFVTEYGFNLSQVGNGEPYKLIRHLSNLMSNVYKNPKILDLGTLHGLSALCFSANENCTVDSYDIVNHKKFEKTNINFITGDATQIVNYEDYNFIYIDIDNHDGFKEDLILSRVLKTNYRGYIMFDDIHLNLNMEKFWSKVRYHFTSSSFDISNIGHSTGTGLLLI